CDAPRSARHDRRADASSNDRPEQEPALRSLRTTGSPWPRSICRTPGQPARLLLAHIGQARRAVRWDVLRNPATGNAPLYGAPRGISGPGPCSPFSFARPSTVIGTARLRPVSRPLGAASAVPPGSCAFLRTGHRYPEEQVSRASPARLLTASGTPRSRSALQG